MILADAIPKKLALFDFDGTITDRDSLIDFVIFSVGRKKFIFGASRLLPEIFRFKLKLITNEELKITVLNYFFAGWPTPDFICRATQYAEQRLPKIVKQSAFDKIQWHRQQQHHVVVVTASVKEWIQPWCLLFGLDLIATELQMDNGKITGELKTPNCSGVEKVRRIQAALDLSSYDYIYAYGDTAADRPMLSLANESYYRCFRD